jgi:hypothetical protein
VRTTDRTAKSASMPKRGLFAVLCGLLHGNGTGAPKITRGGGARFTLKTALFALPALLLASLAFTAAPALAAAPEEPLIAGLEPPTATTAELVGILNPNAAGEAGTFEFLYKKGGVCEGGATAPVPAAPSKGEQYEYAFGKLSGLTPGGEYTACLLAENPAKETAQSAPFSFVLPAEAPVTQPADPVSAKEATLHGVLNPTQPGEPGTYEFVYRQSASECQGGEEKRVPEPAEGAIGAQGEAKEVAITGLLPGTAYTACLLERNALGEPALGNPEMFTTPAASPAITEEAPSGVTSDEATVNAEINPGGAPTTYKVEYGTSVAYSSSTGETSIPSGLNAVPASVTLAGLKPATTYHFRFVATNTAGKIPGVDATLTTPGAEAPPSPPGSCPQNEKLRAEQPYGTALPDCRAYEMVSPLDKDDQNIETINSRASVANGHPGEEEPAFAYVSPGSFSSSGAEPQGAKQVSRYLARREAGGWSTQNISPPSIPFNDNTVPPFQELLFTPDLSAGIVSNLFVPLGEENQPKGYVNLYVADFASTPASYQTATPVTPEHEFGPYEENPGSPATVPQAAGVSTDLSHVVFEQAANLTTNAKSEGNNFEHVYESTDGKLYLVDVPPAGQTFGGFDEVGAPGTHVELIAGDPWHAVSANGSRVFFTAEEAVEGTLRGHPTGQVYVRENPTSATESCSVSGDACTIEVSASQKTNGTGPGGTDPYPAENPSSESIHAWYRDASVNGEHVFFTSRVELTNEANTGPASDPDSAANLYEYNLQTGKLTDLTVDAEENGAKVFGLVTAGDNAGEANSYVYFVANGVLAGNENGDEEKATPGNCEYQPGETPAVHGEWLCNLYVSRYNGVHWETSFIARLAGSNAPTNFGAFITNDEGDWRGNEGEANNSTLEADFGPGNHTVRATPDGATLAFESVRSLTGYDNEPAQPGAGPVEIGEDRPDQHCTTYGSTPGEPAPCREVYLYDAQTEKLVCASCDPSGARPVGAAKLGIGEGEKGGNGLFRNSELYLPRNLSEDGERLFFQSPDALVPGDSDGQVNVYEWEAPAAAPEPGDSCTSSSSSFDSGDGGCVFPISDVTGDFESRFMDASPSGENVFFATADQLVPSDTDTRVDVYDARVGGGFPVAAAPLVCVNADSCKSPESPQPSIYGAPSSATFSGAGNLGGGGSNPPAVVPKPKAKVLTKAQKLAAALELCKKDKSKKKRQSCEASAKKKYGPPKKKPRKASKSHKGGK